MKVKFIKFFCLILASVFAAGAFSLCAFALRLPASTYVNGTYVGGFSRARALEEVRGGIVKELKNKSLTIHAGGNSYVFRYPEIGFKDNAREVIKSISKSGNYRINVSCYLNGFDSVVSGICADQSQVKREPCAIFNPYKGAPFDYEKGISGVYCDRAALAADIKKSLNSGFTEGGFTDVYLHTKEFSPAKTLDDVMQTTVLLSAFTTYYDQSNAARSQNIALAAERVSGSVIKPCGAFSFNQSVGPRTKERGFKSAKIIEGGRYVYGPGGGVCQVSTTLYNAALLAGLKVTEYHPHSLAVNYVSPSRDAMVSGSYFDLKIKNTSDCPVYIRVLTGSGCVRCEVYGKSSGAVYSLNSQLLEDTQDGKINSRCFITREKNGEKTTTLLRTDSYLQPDKSGAAQGNI